jgi:hypothetical protein
VELRTARLSVALLHRLGFEHHLGCTAEQDKSGKNLASCRMRLDREAMITPH